jgi:Tellurite resistance protein TehB
MAHSTGWYDAHASDLVGRYEAVDPANLHNWLRGLLPDTPGTVLDIGAGSGRDAAWFSAQGYDVIAVECGGASLTTGPPLGWSHDGSGAPSGRIRGGIGVSGHGWLRAQRPAGGGAAHAGGGKRVNPEILRDGPRHHRLRELAQEHTATAVAALVDIIKDKKANVGPGIFRQSRGDGAAGGELISRWPYC